MCGAHERIRLRRSSRSTAGLQARLPPQARIILASVLLRTLPYKKPGQGARHGAARRRVFCESSPTLQPPAGGQPRCARLLRPKSAGREPSCGGGALPEML